MHDRNDDGFGELVARNRTRILRICRVYAWNREDRDDLYQEILCQIWRALPKLKNQSHADTWLYRVALNTALSYVRKHKAYRSRMVSDEGASLNQTPDETQDPRSTGNEALERLFQAIAQLEPLEKAVVTLFLDDMSYEEIAEVTGLSASNVGVRLHRAKKKLSSLLEETPCRLKT